MRNTPPDAVLRGRGNRTFDELPAPVGERYIHRMPLWATAMLQLVFAAWCIGLTYFTVDGVNEMRNGLFVLSCVLIIGFALIALYAPKWRQRVAFVADRCGIYFPACTHDVASLDKAIPVRWLLVPWSNVHNPRMARTVDAEADTVRCIAFDLALTRAQVEHFFSHLGVPLDRQVPSRDLFPAAFSDFPPSPRHALAWLRRVSGHV